MKKVKVFSIVFMLIILACTLVGCKNKKKNEEQKNWIEDMKKVSYIQTIGASGEKSLDNELAKIILDNYENNKSTEEETFLANENSDEEGNMFYFYDDNNTILYQVQCNSDGYHGDKICVMEVHKTEERYVYNFHTFDCPEAVQYINNVLTTKQVSDVIE